MPIASQNIKEILKHHKLAPSKKRGQNFLVHRQTAEKIVYLSKVTPEDTVIELGVGLGSLTMPLASRVRKVIGIELDSGIVEYHQKSADLPANVSLLHQDLLKTDYQKLADQCGGRLKIMANLPYSITNPLLFKLFENKNSVEWAVLMLQKEVGERICAAVGTKEYGVLTVLLGTCATVDIIMDVGPAQFHPRPKVDSVVARIVFHPLPDKVGMIPAHDTKLLRRIVNAAFQKRRKTLANALSSARIENLNKTEVLEILTKTGIQENIRAERLTPEDFVRLTCRFTEHLKDGLHEQV